MFGVFFPISSTALAVATLLAFFGLLIYLIYYLNSISAYSSRIKKLNNDFNNNDDDTIKLLGFPIDSSKYFSRKYFDDRLGFATQRTLGTFGIAMCVHPKLDFNRLYFFVDFQKIGSVQAVVSLRSEKEDIDQLTLKITTESSMFLHQSIRYFYFNFEKISCLNIYYNKLDLETQKITVSNEELEQVLSVKEYLRNLSHEDKVKFLGGLKL